MPANHVTQPELGALCSPYQGRRGLHRGLHVLMLGVLVLALALLAGCGGTQSTGSSGTSSAFHAEITDDLGRTVVLDKRPERIVVTSASFLEPLAAVGGDVVGRPDSKTLPDFAKDKASVGKVYQIDVEKVLACEPDLVIVNKGMNEKLVDTLEGNGIQTLVVSGKTYADVQHEISMFAQVTGETAKGEQVLSDMDAQLAQVKEQIKGQSTPRVAIIHSTTNGLSVQLPGSIAGSVAELLGWTNTAADLTPNKKHPDTAPYSLESLVAQNPDVLFITSMGDIEAIKASMTQTMQENPAWQTIPAVRDGRVYYLPQNLFLLSPGLHYPEAAAYMAHCLYPEAVTK